MSVDVLAEARPVAFAVAYRMLGSVSEAEDVVQETLIRIHAVIAAGEPIASPRAFTTTVATRLALNALRAARRRRETYVGERLPEPLVDHDDPADHAQTADSLSVAFLVLLERLTPEQRAAFLLREVFGYGYDEIAEIVGKTPANARQLVTRARRHVEAARPRFPGSRAQADRLADRFFAAAHEGDMGELERLLAADVVLRGDGGGNAPALAHALSGGDRVARTLRNWFTQAARAGAALRRADVNGHPGAVLLIDDVVVCVMALHIEQNAIRGIASIVNPEKLGHLPARAA